MNQWHHSSINAKNVLTSEVTPVQRHYMFHPKTQFCDAINIGGHEQYVRTPHTNTLKSVTLDALPQLHSDYSISSSTYLSMSQHISIPIKYAAKKVPLHVKVLLYTDYSVCPKLLEVYISIHLPVATFICLFIFTFSYCYNYQYCIQSVTPPKDLQVLKITTFNSTRDLIPDSAK